MHEDTGVPTLINNACMAVVVYLVPLLGCYVSESPSDRYIKTAHDQNESTEVQTLGAVYTTREERHPAMPKHCVWT